MKLRAYIFDDNEIVRTLLQQVLRERGYEVFAFSQPDLCPLHKDGKCACPDGCACGDIILSDLKMPIVNGLEFLQRQRAKGCRLKFIALMSGAWTMDALLMAKLLDCKVFHKPFTIAEVNAWLDECEKQIDPKRCIFHFSIDRFKNPPIDPSHKIA